MNAQERDALVTKCDKCGIFKWGNAVTGEEVCPVCDLGFPPKKVAGYERMSQDVLVEESMCEARNYERERCARVCDEKKKKLDHVMHTGIGPTAYAVAFGAWTAVSECSKAIRQRKS